jgi:hypothetical protein
MGKRNGKKYLLFQAIKKNGFFEELEKFEISNTSTNRNTKIKAYFRDYELFLEKNIDYKNELYLALDRKIKSLV